MKKLSAEKVSELKAELVTTREKIDDLVMKYNEMIGEEETSLKDISDNDEETKKLVKQYTGIAKDITFDRLSKADDSMLEAVKELNYKTIAVKDSIDKESDITTRIVVDGVEKPIELLKLHKYCGGIGENSDWPIMIEKFNLLMTCKVAEDIKSVTSVKEIRDSFAMSEAAKEYNMGNDLGSIKKMVEAINKIVWAMIGDDYKALNHDAKYIDYVYAKKSRNALKVACSNQSGIIRIFQEVCHRMVTNGHYDVEFKKAKK